jgi:ribosomal protein S18 acetylase RimI-like enzyme
MSVEMDPTLQLRPATAADVEAMREVEIDAGDRFRVFPPELGFDEIADDEPPAPEVLLGHVDSDSGWVVVDPANGDLVVGYAVASMMDDDAHLDQVSVRGAYERRGIGTALLDTVFAWATELGFEAITLTTFRDVSFNGPYYERRGFRELSAHECGPELRALRQHERDIGLDVQPRIAMRRHLL